MTLWNRNGSAALISAQPYGLSGKDLQDLSAIECDDDFEVSIDTSWYGGGTVFVAVWNAIAYVQNCHDL